MTSAVHSVSETTFRRALARIEGALARPVDIRWLAVFRLLFGFAMAFSMARFIAYGWIDQLLVAPKFHFKYWGFSWVAPLGEAGMHLLFWTLLLLALCVAIGFCFRIAATLFFVGFSYLQLIDVATYLNHYYLACLLALLLALSPAGRYFSIDVLLRPAHRKAEIAAAWLYLFRFQIAVVYSFAGLAKAHGDWLWHGHPLRIWLGAKTDMPLLGDLFTHPWAPYVLSWAGFLFDSTIVWWLLFRKTRPYAYAVVVIFHAITRLLFPIGMFPVIMVLGALVFFPPDWPKRFLRRIIGEERATSEQRWPRPALFLGAMYCVFQLLIPLRFALYGGNVRWHEQGMRFSWRVMVREKNGLVTFVVKSKTSSKVWHVKPRDYLTPLQEREMSTQPDLILQLAHHIRSDFARRGLGPVDVYVDAIASLNGRRARRLVDPTIALSSVEDGVGFASWIEPAPGEAPPHIRPLK